MNRTNWLHQKYNYIKRVLLLLLSILITLSGFTYSVQAGTFAALHGSRTTSEDDAYYFATQMQSYGWTPKITCRYSRYCRIGTLSHFSNANANIVYWSGHGLSSGAFSYYTAAVGNHNLDRSSTTIKNSYVNYPDSTKKYYTYAQTLQQNSATDWLILASCNQMTNATNKGKYKAVLQKTGSARPMKGILGYGTGGLAPDGTDDAIAKRFVNLCFDPNGRRRTVYAWLQANAYYGYYNARAMVIGTRIDDTLTSGAISSINANQPIKFVYYNTSNVAQIQTASSVTPHKSDTPALISVSTNSNITNADELPQMEEINESNETLPLSIPFESEISEDSIQFEIPESSVESLSQEAIDDIVQSELSESDIDMSEFKPYKELELIAEGDEEEEVIEKSLIYAHYIDGVRVSILPEKGEQIIAEIGLDGNSEIHYNTIDELDTKDICSNQEADISLSESEAESIALDNIEQSQLDTAEESPYIESSELVYVISPTDQELVLAWETFDSYGNYKYIDPNTGVEMEWPEPEPVG